MAGGLLNLVSNGSQNIIMYGNPQKTYWSSTYKQITNFGLQNFRLDYDGLRELQLTTDTIYNFKVKRYAELLKDTFLVINLPDIYSPLYQDETPYEFQWIKNIGAMMIRSIRFTIGGSLIQHITGHDIVALANRDLTSTEKAKWDEMTGNVPELYNPSSYHNNLYPNAVYQTSSTYQTNGSEPSIRGRQLRVPLPIWWALNAQQAFPLVSLQYNMLHIEVTLRPIHDLFQIRDVTGFPTTSVIAPVFTNSAHQFYLFLQSPPETLSKYSKITSWNEETHLSCTYCFLSEEEAYLFASKEQRYLIREIYNSWYYDVSVTDKIWLQNSTDLVLSWMMLFQRSDITTRNEWSNFTNWPYDYLPIDVSAYTTPNGSNLYIQPSYATENQKDILLTMGISLDGTTREEMRPASVYKYEQQYLTSRGGGYSNLSGLYTYNFCLKTDPFSLQPSGAMNLSKYSNIELEFVTITPTLNSNALYYSICNPLTGESVGVNKQTSIYNYTFNLLVIEERYNVLTFIGGNAGLMNAR